MKLNLISCVFPDYGSHMIYVITTVIDNWNFFFPDRMVGEYREKIDSDLKGDK